MAASKDREPVRLLDVNLLVALAWPQHVHHGLAHHWLSRLAGAKWATCPLTQLGFVRISSNPKIIAEAVSPRAAAQALGRITSQPAHLFWPDDIALAGLPSFDSTAFSGHRQVTDAYLIELARHHKGRLATLDRSVPGLLASAADRARLVEVIQGQA